MTITVSTYVRGNIRGTGIAGQVVETYAAKIYGFDLPMVKVLREDNGKFAYLPVGDVEVIEIRAEEDIASMICSDGYVITRGMVAAEIERTERAQREMQPHRGPAPLIIGLNASINMYA